MKLTLYRWRLARLLGFVIVLLLSYYRAASAQEYFFSVPKAWLEVEIQPDGGAVLFYRMDFRNSANGHSIDIVDVGLPHENYDTGQMKAWVHDHQEVGPIQVSQYVKPGVEVHLGSFAIPAGGTGRFEFEARIPDLAFQDTTRKDYASFQISPTWFGDQYVDGTTDLTIRVILPPGLKPEEVLHQDVSFTGKEEQDGKVVLSWQVNRRFTSPYRVGVSYPKRVMQKVVTMSITQLMMRWWRGIFPVATRGWLIFGSAILLFIIYLRFTGGTGCIFFAPILIAGAFFFVKFQAAEVFIWPILVILAIIVETARKKRRSKYLPAIASVEGGGIKRGLTAPEAAVLLELPVSKVITLVLFGMLKKGEIRQITKDPVMVEVERNPPPDAILHDYEKEFLELLKRRKLATTISKTDFSKPLQALVDSVAKRMVGYDLDETQGYYKHIISRAWKEAQEVGEVEAWQKKMDEKVDWMMLDPDFTGRFRPHQDQYIPRSFRPTTIGIPGGAALSSKPSSSSGTTPRFSDVAASVSGWFQNTSAEVVGSMEGQKGGILNLGSIDKAIGKAMASGGGGSRSGGGGGCACACAGCACACACAGGGR